MWLQRQRPRTGPREPARRRVFRVNDAPILRHNGDESTSTCKPIPLFHSSGSSRVICYSVPLNKLLWELHSWDDYLDRSHSAVWLESIFISLRSPQRLWLSVLVLQVGDGVLDAFAVTVRAIRRL